MALNNEYQYIGRSNAVKDQNDRYSYFILLYAKTVGDISTGKHTVAVKQRLVSTSTNTFYGYSTSGSISIAGTTVESWSYANVPGGAWSENSLTEDGVTYPRWVDLKEGLLTIDVGYGVTKNISIGASWTFKSGSAGYLPQKNVSANVSATVSLPMIAGASVPTVSKTTIDFGNKLVIYTNRIAGAGFTHTISYRFGSVSETIGTNIGDSIEWTPSIELARQIPNATSGSAVIKCTTYLGSTLIGTKEISVSLTVPEGVVPSVSATWEDKSGAYEKVGIFVNGVSKLSVSVSATGVYGSTPVSSDVKLQGKKYSGSIINEVGDLQLVASVTDSRGRISSQSYTISVAEYSTPSLTLSASRCLSDGTADEAGDYAKITIAGFVFDVNNQNEASLLISWSEDSESVSPSVGDVFWQKIVPADPNNTMGISAQLSDKIATAEKTMVLSTGYATLDFLAGGKGIAFGKAATKEGFECAMTASFPGGIACTKLTAADDLNNIRQNGLYYWDLGDAPANAPSARYGEAYYMNTLRVWSANGNICCQEAIDVSDSSTRGTKLVRTLYGGRAYPWEWENPPMTLGNEYLTTERYNGKPVYTMLFDCGALPNATSKEIAHGISNCIPISYYGSISNQVAINSYPRIDVTFGYTKVIVESKTDQSAFNLHIALKYTKN